MPAGEYVPIGEGLSEDEKGVDERGSGGWTQLSGEERFRQDSFLKRIALC